MAMPEPPAHLSPPTAAWWASVVATFDLDAHHVELLRLAAEALDRGEAARVLLAAEGLTYTSKGGEPRAHPAAGIARDAAIAFARLTRELGLDVAPPAEAGRPHPLRANRGA